MLTQHRLRAGLDVTAIVAAAEVVAEVEGEEVEAAMAKVHHETIGGTIRVPRSLVPMKPLKDTTIVRTLSQKKNESSFGMP